MNSCSEYRLQAEYRSPQDFRLKAVLRMQEMNLKFSTQRQQASHHFVGDGRDVRRRFNFLSVTLQFLEWFER